MNINKFLLRTKLLFYISKQDLNISNSDKINIIERNRRKQSINYSQKIQYMNSSEWKTMQKVWLYKKNIDVK